MKKAARVALRFLPMLICVLVGASPSVARTIHSKDIVDRAGGENSLPGAILGDGTVCAMTDAASHQCEPLFVVPPQVIQAFRSDYAFFDGIFDLDRSGTPQVFIDYWPDSADANCPAEYKDKDGRCDAIALLIFKKSSEIYRQDVVLHAPTAGYSPSAWFLDEAPTRKAIFETRYAGSSGDGLFYLEWKKRSLELISDDFFMNGSPAFEDLDADGNAEIFVPARGRDRTAKQGVALFRWKHDAYELWWPKFTKPYVVYAQMLSIADDAHKEIIGLLDPSADPREGSTKRELAVWKLERGAWRLIDKRGVPGVPDMEVVAFPELSTILARRDRAEVLLTYSDGTVTACQYKKEKITCSDTHTIEQNSAIH